MNSAISRNLLLLIIILIAASACRSRRRAAEVADALPQVLVVPQYPDAPPSDRTATFRYSLGGAGCGFGGTYDGVLSSQLEGAVAFKVEGLAKDQVCEMRVYIEPAVAGGLTFANQEIGVLYVAKSVKIIEADAQGTLRATALLVSNVLQPAPKTFPLSLKVSFPEQPSLNVQPDLQCEPQLKVANRRYEPISDVTGRFVWDVGLETKAAADPSSGNVPVVHICQQVYVGLDGVRRYEARLGSAAGVPISGNLQGLPVTFPLGEVVLLKLTDGDASGVNVTLSQLSEGENRCVEGEAFDAQLGCVPVCPPGQVLNRQTKVCQRGN